MTDESRWFRLRPVQFAIYLVLRSLAAVVEMFPYSMAPAIGRILGTLIRWFDYKHRKIARVNLERAGFPVSLLPRVYDNAGLLIVEMLMVPRLLRHHGLERYIRLERFDIFDRELARGKGVIAVIAHLGNWELGGLAANLAGYTLHSLARPIENPYIERWVLRTRTITGQRIIPKYDALRTMVEVLKRNGILVIQADQDARDSGVPALFFGRTASTTRGPALLSLKYGAPIVPVNVFRDEGMHRAILTDSLYPDAYRGRPDAVEALTQAFTSRFEEFVRQHPEQWNWLHRRWKSEDRARKAGVPEGAAARG